MRLSEGVICFDGTRFFGDASLSINSFYGRRGGCIEVIRGIDPKDSLPR